MTKKKRTYRSASYDRSSDTASLDKLRNLLFLSTLFFHLSRMTISHNASYSSRDDALPGEEMGRMRPERARFFQRKLSSTELLHEISWYTAVRYCWINPFLNYFICKWKTNGVTSSFRITHILPSSPQHANDECSCTASWSDLTICLHLVCNISIDRQ